MQIGMIGLGRMGANMALRLIAGGHRCVVFDRSAKAVEELDRLPARRVVMLKITLPERDDLYAEFVGHPKVVRVLALSGGYTREEGNTRLRRNHGVVASFSRALLEGLSAQQSDAEYDVVLDASIQSIFEASNT